MIASIFLVALGALPLPEAVDSALARWPQTEPGILAVTVSIEANNVREPELRTQLLSLIRGRALHNGLAESVVVVDSGPEGIDRARRAGAEHLLELELRGDPVDTLEVRVRAVDPGGLWGRNPPTAELPLIAAARIPFERPASNGGNPENAKPRLRFVPVSALAERPLAMALCRDSEGTRRLVVLHERGATLFIMRGAHLTPPKTLDLAFEVSSTPVRAPFGHAVCMPKPAGAAIVGHGHASAAVIIETSVPRTGGTLLGLPLATDGVRILLGSPSKGTNVLEPVLDSWPRRPAPSIPEPSRRVLYDRRSGWLFATVRGPVVDASGRERLPAAGNALAAAEGRLLVSGAQLDAGRDRVRLWDLEDGRWLSNPSAFDGAVLAVALDADHAFAAIQDTGQEAGAYRLYRASIPRKSSGSREGAP